MEFEMIHKSSYTYSEGQGLQEEFSLTGRMSVVCPDERAIAGQIGRALREPVPAIGQKSELHSGFWHSGGTIQQTLAEWRKEEVTILC